MKLLIENTEEIEILKEETSDGKKNLYISGVFMEYDIKNHNGRIYPKSIMEKEVNRYINENIKKGMGYGELQHPSNPQINLDRVSHLIQSLHMENNGKVMGKALVLDTPCGNIVRGLIEGGAQLGVSSRGVGSLKEGKDGSEVQEDFRLVTPADCVSSPSAPSAFVQGIMEDCEWFYCERSGSFLPESAYQMKEVLKKKSTKQIEEAKLFLFEQFLQKISNQSTRK